MTKKQLQQTIDILLKDREHILAELTYLLDQQKNALAGLEAEVFELDPEEVLKADIFQLSRITEQYGYNPTGMVS